MALGNPFGDLLQTRGILLSNPVQYHVVHAIRCEMPGLDEDTVDAFDNLTCLEPMRGNFQRVQPVLVGVVVVDLRVEVVRCQWAAPAQNSKGPLEGCLRIRIAHVPCQFWRKSLARSLDIFHAVVQDVLEAESVVRAPPSEKTGNTFLPVIRNG